MDRQIEDGFGSVSLTAMPKREGVDQTWIVRVPAYERGVDVVQGTARVYEYFSRST